MMTTTTSSYVITSPISKKDILFRLFNAGHITFDELWVLAQDTVVNNYIPAPTPVFQYPPVFLGDTNDVRND